MSSTQGFPRKSVSTPNALHSLRNEKDAILNSYPSFPGSSRANYDLVLTPARETTPRRISSFETLPASPSHLRLFSLPLIAPSVSSFTFYGTLGCGSYGKVLLAHVREEPLGILRAVKIIPKRKEPFHGTRILRESEILSSLAQSFAHTTQPSPLSFLQRLIYSVESERHLFLVLEYHPAPLSDPNIKARLLLLPTPRRHRLSESTSLPACLATATPYQKSAMTALRLLSAELVLGLIYLHQRGIIHQDLKCSNVMISLQGHVVITDFGSSTIVRTPLLPSLRPGDLRVALRPEEAVAFTPFYAAPELQTRTEEDWVIYDERVDWWSMGVLLYELGTGSYPHVDQHTDLRRTRLSRTEGALSLTFGELQAISVSNSPGNWWDPNFEDFVRSLLVFDVDARLSDDQIQDHSFFIPIRHAWNAIVALKHPPLENPAPTRMQAATTPHVSPRYRSDLLSQATENELGTIASGQSSYFDAWSRIPPSAPQLRSPPMICQVTHKSPDPLSNLVLPAITIHGTPCSSEKVQSISRDDSSTLSRAFAVADDSSASSISAMSTSAPCYSIPVETPQILGPSFSENQLNCASLEEVLTISVLKAMDHRDRYGLPRSSTPHSHPVKHSHRKVLSSLISAPSSLWKAYAPR